MQEDETITCSQLTVEEVAQRYAAGTRLTREELEIIQNDRATAEQFVAIVKRLLAQEARALRSSDF